MPASQTDVLVGRRYLDRGFLDAAMKIFVRNAPMVAAKDWATLAERLLERQRLSDVVRVCEVGGVPLPQQKLLEIGDLHLRRKDFDGAIRLYEMADADHERWTHIVDLLTAMPDRERQVLGIAERHLGKSPGPSPAAPVRLVAGR
jgi:hypothetical protein